MSDRTPYYFLALLGSACFSLATLVQPRAMNWSQHGQDSVLKVLLGDGRRIFANHFFTKADIYFHSGYYPSIFDRRDQPKESHMKGHEHGEEEEDHEKEADFLGRPGDWVESFGRHFMITRHTHLEHGQEGKSCLGLSFQPNSILNSSIHTPWVLTGWQISLGRAKRRKTFCERDCAPIRTATSYYSRWGGSATTTSMIQPGHETFGRPRSGGGMNRKLETKNRTNWSSKRSQFTWGDWKKRRAIIARRSTTWSARNLFRLRRKHSSGKLTN